MKKFCQTAKLAGLSKRFFQSSKNLKNTATLKQEGVTLDFTDTKILYSSRSTCELVKSLAILQSCRIPSLSQVGEKVLAADPTPISKIGAKMTYFSHFCGGETLQECKGTVSKLYKDNIGSILDYSVEGASGVKGDLAKEKVMDKVAKVIEDSIIFAGESSPAISHGVIKVSGVSDTNLLERISKILTFNQHNNYEAWELIPKSLAIEGYKPQRISPFNDDTADSEAPEALEDWEEEELARVLNRMEDVCKKCVELETPLLIDAEQSWLQPAIDQIFMKMNLKYNKKGLVKKPILYNTYQLYLSDALSRLKYDTEFMEAESKKLDKEVGVGSGYYMAAKLVRGAYMHSEGKRVAELNLEYPFNSSINATHKAYNSGIEYMLNKMKEYPDLGLVVASHNKESVLKGINKMDELGMQTDDSRVTFGQLYGMCDYMTLALSKKGYNVSKYVCFGSLTEVLPYLSRRLQENSDILGGSAQEITNLRKELMRRTIGI